MGFSGYIGWRRRSPSNVVVETKAVLFHIGYHKTGTTFLQKSFFERFECFLRVPQRKIFHELIYPHDFTFDTARATDFVQTAQNSAASRNAVAVFSNERLSGGPHSGGYDSLQILHRIKACAPEARILVFVREQKAMLLSMYAQYVRGVGCLSLQEYCGSSRINHRKELFQPIYLDFELLVRAYKNEFERVMVLPFEQLVADYKSVLRSVLAVSGLPEEHWPDVDAVSSASKNKSRAPSQQRLDRYLHPLRSPIIPHVGTTYYSRFSRIVAGGISRTAALLPLGWLDNRLKRKDKAFINSFVEDRFEESNKRLADLIGVDLSQYGYY